MKNRFKSLFFLFTFIFSMLFSVYSVEAFEEITSILTETDVQIDESIIMDEDITIYSEFLPYLIKYEAYENSFLFYDQLDNNNKATYDAMKQWLKPTTEELIVKFPDTISYKTTSTDIDSWDKEQYDEFWNLIFSNLLYGEKAFTFDHPEFFWLDNNKIGINLHSVKIRKNFFSNTYTMNISELKLSAVPKEVYADVDEAENYIRLLEDSVDAFKIKGSDRYQQIKYIHDYIIENVSYNLDAPYHDSAIGLFCEPYQIVCEGYSKAFKILCNKADIPCIVITGNIDTEARTGHMWNYVMMEDNKWYGVDCTWDDTDLSFPAIKYSYFLKGSKSFISNHSSEDIFTYPELSIEDYEYRSELPLTTAPVTTAPTETITTIKTDVTDPTQNEHISGDYNTDGKISIADVIILKNHIVNKPYEVNTFSYDDLNDDNNINVFDCVILIRMILKGV